MKTTLIQRFAIQNKVTEHLHTSSTYKDTHICKTTTLYVTTRIGMIARQILSKYCFTQENASNNNTY